MVPLNKFFLNYSNAIHFKGVYVLTRLIEICERNKFASYGADERTESGGGAAVYSNVLAGAVFLRAENPTRACM